MGAAVIASVASILSAVITAVLAYLLTRHMARESEERETISHRLDDLTAVGHALVSAQPPRAQRRMRLPPGW